MPGGPFNLSTAQSLAPEIVASDIHKSYSGKEVLKGISATIRRGEITAIVGHSGSGKTVFLDHLTGLQTPDKGSIKVVHHGQKGMPMVDLVGIDPDVLDEVRLFWAIVFQHNALFTGTVYDNIALWLREHTELPERKIRGRVREALEAVKLEVDDVVEKERDALSGGMAKRVAIARAIAMDPAVIFYDEPTTGLDPVVGGHVHELIWNVHHRPIASLGGDGKVGGGGLKRTSIVITHDKDLLRRISPRIIMLDEGRVIFDGPYERFRHADVPAARKYLETMPVLHARPAV
ncbi:MAG TPA: ATP-binding cassette domain-containing protein [Phycisphaerales bacterium]|nr:ATP-binding cassette domain-containing protein [Phycisphaerales bacterium]